MTGSKHHKLAAASPSHLRTVTGCLLAGLLGLTGCLFETREAQTPGGGSNWVSPTEPSKVLDNMETGLEGLKGGNYERSIGDIFEFIALQGDYDNFPGGELENWDQEVEIDSIRKLLGQASKIDLVFTGFTQISSTGTISKYTVFYKLTVTYIADPQNPEAYQAKAQFDFQQGSAGYQLIRWEDIQVVEGATWGYLRGTLRTL
jgi:hypothetical protein